MASAIKMCRMITGLEALVIENYTAARKYGVGDHVLPTVVQRGKGRAEEMRESANTVREAGFEPCMAAAIADKQPWAADQAPDGVFKDVAKRAGRTPRMP